MLARGEAGQQLAKPAARPRPPQWTALEIATGYVFGAAGEKIPLEPSSKVGPLEALERAVRPALERPPCIVSFSGGRDSSCVLATATRVARREGLEAPIPVTLRFPDAPEAEESDWQELVVRYLGLRDWEHLEVEDCYWIGPLAAPVLRRHGILLPPSTFAHWPIVAAARGGSLLTGYGGDLLFGGWRWRSLADPLARRRRPRPYDALRFAYAALPAALRTPRERRRQRVPAAPDWIRPAARRRLLALAARQAAHEPVWWRDWVRWRARGRSLNSTPWSLGLLADEADVLAVSPLSERGFVAALARAGGRLGFSDRTAAMITVFDGVLPEALLRRTSKASFDGIFWRGHSADFAERWDGTGVDEAIVDPEALRREWQAPQPDLRSALPLQAAWLAHQRHRDNSAAGR